MYHSFRVPGSEFRLCNSSLWKCIISSLCYFALCSGVQVFSSASCSKNSSLYSFHVEVLKCDGKLVRVSAIPSYNLRCLLLSLGMRSNAGKAGETEGRGLALIGSRRPELKVSLLACLLACLFRWLVLWFYTFILHRKYQGSQPYQVTNKL